MSIGSSSWVSIEPQLIDRVVAAGMHEHFAETDITVQILTGIGTLEAF
jgi:cyclopropane fatty-acyl-phospholipid synthase-like methyltransferase